MRRCLFAGCEHLTRGSTGFCRLHYRTARRCRIQGCDNWLSSYNRTGVCQVHRAFAR